MQISQVLYVNFDKIKIRYSNINTHFDFTYYLSLLHMRIFFPISLRNVNVFYFVDRFSIKAGFTHQKVDRNS